MGALLFKLTTSFFCESLREFAYFMNYHNFLTDCLPSLCHFLTNCYTSRLDSKRWGEPFWGCCRLHSISNCSPSPYHFLTKCYASKIDNDMRREPFWGFRCLHTISLSIAYHLLTISLPNATRAGLTTKCEGNHFGVVAICIPSPYHVLTKCHMSRIDSKMWGEPFWVCCHLHTIS